MWVDKRRMEASARITCRFLGLHEGDSALLCLPLDYIAGKMMVVRALTCGLRLIEVPPDGHPLASHRLQEQLESVFSLDNPKECIDFAAMVPLQVYNSLQVPEERDRLRQIRHLIIGGGAIDDSMVRELRFFPHAVWSTYGMTETLSHIALRRLNGQNASEWYTPFESVGVSLTDDGCLVIDAPQVCAERLVTNDKAEINNGRFRILGRKDNVICSGGIKIQIEEVERQLKGRMAAPFMITKMTDVKLGEAMVLLTEGSTEEAEAICNQLLGRHSRPRRYMQVDHLPMTETGKPARAQAQKMVKQLLE